MTSIKDEDNMASDSDTALATQQSIKAYVDSQVATSDTLQEVTDNGATTTNAIQLGSNLGVSGDTFFEGALSGTGAITAIGNISTDGIMKADVMQNFGAGQGIQIDADGFLGLDSGSGDIRFRSGGGNELHIDMDGTAGAQVISPSTVGDDIIFKNQGGDSVLTLKSEGQTEVHSSLTVGGNLGISGDTFFEGTLSGTGSVTVLGNITTAGDITTDNAIVRDNIQHEGDTSNEISFASATQDFRTNNTSRLDISNSGVRLGGANSRVTTILDEDNMASDSNTALSTQQSIKAYVDSQVATSDTLQEVTDNGTTTTNALQFGSNLGISGDTFFEGILSGTGAIDSVGQISSSSNIISGAEVKVGTNLQVADNIQHIGDTTNEISFATNSQDFRTNNSSRLDINDDGIRLGGANSRVTTILDEDAMGTDSNTALATQQSIKAYSDTKLPLAGGTMSGSINLGDNDITNVDSLDTDKFSIASGTEMTSIKDEDNMTSDSNVALATQQSIKAYVDSQVGGADTLQEVTDNGATTTNAIQLGSNLGISGNTFFEGALSGTGSVTVIGNITTDGNVSADNARIRDNIQHEGDTSNEISFASATQDFRTNNSSRLDISNSGIRLGSQF